MNKVIFTLMIFLFSTSSYAITPDWLTFPVDQNLSLKSRACDDGTILPFVSASLKYSHIDIVDDRLTTGSWNVKFVVSSGCAVDTWGVAYIVRKNPNMIEFSWNGVNSDIGCSNLGTLYWEWMGVSKDGQFYGFYEFEKISDSEIVLYTKNPFICKGTIRNIFQK